MMFFPPLLFLQVSGAEPLLYKSRPLAYIMVASFTHSDWTLIAVGLFSNYLVFIAIRFYVSLVEVDLPVPHPLFSRATARPASMCDVHVVEVQVCQS